MASDQTLDHLRREIDSIDDQIHDLLMRRTEIVGEIGALKRESEGGPLALRPGREAQIIRRLVRRHSGPFPIAVLVRIWRELLSAQVAVQGDYSIAVFAPDDVVVYRDLCRDQFGAFVPIRRYQSVSQVVKDVWNRNVSIGILPFPMGERVDPWWRLLVSFGENMPRIIAHLPFFEADATDSERQTAVAIAMIDPEPTGDDVTLMAIERVGDVSRDRMRDDLRACGLEAEWISSWHDPDVAGRTLHLVSVRDFVTALDSRLKAFRDHFSGAIREVLPLGSYARPISPDDLRHG